MFSLIPSRRRYDLMPDVFREMEDFFKEVANRDFFTTMLPQTETVLTPRIDVAETKDALIVKADLPGFEAKDFDITVDNDQLVIKGEKKEEKEEAEKQYHRYERSYSSFYRAVCLPVDVNKEKIEATYKNGVLDIVLPKAEEAIKNVKHITVQ